MLVIIEQKNLPASIVGAFSNNKDKVLIILNKNLEPTEKYRLAFKEFLSYCYPNIGDTDESGNHYVLYKDHKKGKAWYFKEFNKLSIKIL